MFPKVTTVIADGSVLTASATENPDLFWAIRGGGSNFGVCVEFVIQLHQQRRTVYSGFLIFPPHLVDAVLGVTEKWWKAGPGPKESLVQIVTKGPPPDYHVSVPLMSYCAYTTNLVRDVALCLGYPLLQWHCG